MRDWMRKGTLLLLVLTMGMGAKAPVWANSAPVVVDPLPGGALAPAEQIPVRVTGEELTFRLEGEGEEMTSAWVTVRYQLENPTPDRVKTLVAFPYDGGGKEDLTITYNGQKIQPEKWEEEKQMERGRTLLEGFQAFKPLAVHPISGAPLQGEGVDMGAKPGMALFSMEFAPESKGELMIEYDHGAGRYAKNFIHPVATFHYLLLPAKAWGGFENLKIRVEGPQGVAFAANLPLELVNAGGENGYWIREGRFDALPKENLAFSVMFTKGLWGNRTEKDLYGNVTWALLIPILALGALIPAWGLGSRPWWMGWLIGWPVALLAGFLLGIGGPALLEKFSPVLGYGAFGHGGFASMITAGTGILLCLFLYPVLLLWRKSIYSSNEAPWSTRPNERSGQIGCNSKEPPNS